MPITRSKPLALALLLAGIAVSAWAFSVAWPYLAQLPRPASANIYGKSVGVDGNYGLVGSNQGADLFRRPPPNTPLPPHLWLHVQHFAPLPGSTGLFGSSVAIDGDRLAIGAPYGDPQLVNNGYVDIYERVGSAWNFTQKVVATAFDIPPPLYPELEFGSPIVLRGDTLIVGARHFFDTAGRVFVFERNGGLFQQTQQLKPPVDVKETSFGGALALSGDTLAVGRGGMGGAGGPPLEPTVPGEVHVYVRANGLWTLQQVLVSPAAAPADHFGQSLDLHGDRLVVRSKSAVVLFVRSAGVWASQWQHAVPILALSSSASVSLRPSGFAFVEDDLFVGNPNGSLWRGLPGAGYVVRFTGSSSGPGFVPFGTLQDPDPIAGGHFGASLSGSGNLLLVGAPAAAASDARARVFQRQSPFQRVP